MALILRLRRALVSTSISAFLLRPAATASTFRLLQPAHFALLPLPRPCLLPGAAVGFRSTATDLRTGFDGLLEEKDDEILCDYNHWVIIMDFPDPQPSREEMIETYLQTLAQVVGSYEEAKKRMYAFSTTTYTGFQAVMTEEMSEKFRGLPGVLFILPDSILYPETKEYGGDKYDNGVITPSRPIYQWGESQRNGSNGNSRGN